MRGSAPGPGWVFLYANEKYFVLINTFEIIKKEHSAGGGANKSEKKSLKIENTYLIVKPRSRSRSGEGQVKVRKVQLRPELYPIFGLFT